MLGIGWIQRIAVALLVIATALILSGHVNSQEDNSQSVRTSGFTRLRDQVQAVVTAKVAPGVSVLVAQHGNVIFKEARGSLSVESRVHIASMTKSAVASAIMVLADQKKLSLEDPISKYLAEFLGTPVAMATIRQLLSHTSGITGAMLPAKPQIAPDGGFQGSFFARPATFREFAKYCAKNTQLVTPGEFKYADANYDLLCAVVEEINSAFEDHIGKNLFKPLGMKSIFSHQEGMCIRCGGGMEASLDDVYVLYQMHLNGGTFAGKRVLSVASVNETHEKQAYGELADGRVIEYGLGFMRDRVLPDGNARTIYHTGYFGTMAWADFDYKLVGVLFFDAEWQKVKSTAEEMQGLIREIVTARAQ